MSSENLTGADNQQETASSCNVLDPNWMVGFVDGEGCFWQLQPVFHICQHSDHRGVLEAMVPCFGCGRIRPKGPKSSVLTFAVDSLWNLGTAIVPFFEKYPLVVKQNI